MLLVEVAHSTREARHIQPFIFLSHPPTLTLTLNLVSAGFYSWICLYPDRVIIGGVSMDLLLIETHLGHLF